MHLKEGLLFERKLWLKLENGGMNWCAGAFAKGDVILMVLLYKERKSVLGNFNLQKNEANILWCHLRALPIVEVVLKISISFAKLEILQKAFIIHNVQAIEYIKTILQNDTKVRSRKR